tara:strand:- start:26399 stop:26845 length:447 start_codon:yes stop_codon:yes gene_type:complete
LTAARQARSLSGMSAIRTIRNLGPKSEATFARAGITSAEELRSMGADQAYLAAMRAGMRPHFIGYYALVLGLQGRPWTDCTGSEKTALRKQFDALCRQGLTTPRAAASDGLPDALATFLDQIGVGTPGQSQGQSLGQSQGQSPGQSLD